MRFESPLVEGTLLKRYKRFLADVRLADGALVVAHVANTGAMTGLALGGARVALSYHPGEQRKLHYSLELVQAGEAWVCVNTARANAVVEEALRAGAVPALTGYEHLKREVRSPLPAGPGEPHTRLDLLLWQGDAQCYLEVKSVTLRLGEAAAFPDAVTARGLRHAEDLARLVKSGARAGMVYLVNRPDCEYFRPAVEVDPAYAAGLRAAVAAGVEVFALRSRVSLEEVVVEGSLPVRLDAPG